MRLIAISDLHGHLKPFERLLDTTNYDPAADQLVLLGDYVDRGHDSRAVVARVRSLVADGAIALMGNHEDMMIRGFLREDSEWQKTALHNGGAETLASYGLHPPCPDAVRREPALRADLEFLASLPNRVVEQGIRFVHAGLRLDLPWDQQSAHDLLWIRDDWTAHPFAGRLPGDAQPVLVVHGHTPTFHIRGKSRPIRVIDEPWRVNIDCGLTYGGCLAAWIWPDRKALYI